LARDDKESIRRGNETRRKDMNDKILIDRTHGINGGAA
jgi:hypothetical protein